MDYKKKYKEALEIARSCLKDGTITSTAKNYIETIFPELKESEDKRIKNDCIKYLDYAYQHCTTDVYKKAIERCIAWLEKQYEQKPAWSEEDSLMYEKLNDTLEGRIATWKGWQVPYVAWLKSLKDRVQPQQKSAWNYEDERMCQETIDWFEKKCFPYALEEENPARDSIKWLKSLKDRVQSQWKPSDEQMNALDSTLQYSQVSRNSFEHLNSLFNDLKKLK